MAQQKQNNTMPTGIPKNGINTGRFKKGQISWLKGTKGVQKPNSGSFKKGMIPWNNDKPRSEETKRKISITLSKYICTEEHGKNISKSLKGRVFSKEWLEKNREGQIRNPNRKFKDTSIELKVEAELQKRGIHYQKQVPLCKIARIDFLLPDSKIVIQCDGCYYHNCLIHHPNEHIKAQKKDIKQDLILISNGYKVFRFWEHEINESVEKCFDRIVI